MQVTHGFHKLDQVCQLVLNARTHPLSQLATSLALAVSAQAVCAFTVQDSGCLRLVAAHGLPESLLGQEDRLLCYASSKAFFSDKPVAVEDHGLPGALSLPDWFPQGVFGSTLSVAIPGPGRKIGVLSVHFHAPRIMCESDYEIASSMAVVGSQLLLGRMFAKELGSGLAREQQVLDSVSEGVFAVDNNGAITMFNRAASELTGHKAQDVIGLDVSEVLQHTMADGRPALFQDSALAKVLSEGGSRTVVEEWFWSKEGRNFPVEYACSALRLCGEVVGVLVVFHDVSDKKQAALRLQYQADHDELTGLHNRSYFMRRLDSVLQAPLDRGSCAVLCLDLDNFKYVNDSLGHSLGDRILRGISLRLWNALSASDVVARLGGDEFAILLTNVSSPLDAVDKAEDIQAELKTPTIIDGYEIFLGASIGIVSDLNGYHQSDDILRDADTAMFQAKTQGKSQHEVFTKTMHDKVKRHLSLETDLRRALEREELFLQYQPIFEVGDLSCVGFEALVRWQHPERGLVPPVEFIPLAESSGLILPLGEWVLGEACRQMRVWNACRPEAASLSMSVNLSSRQFVQTDLVKRVAQAIEVSGISPSQLKLEITESVIMGHAEAAVATLNELYKLGVSLVVDDFGTGYSSLSYLRRFPVDTLKVDRSFVHQMDVDQENYEIVRTIIGLAGALDLAVVAEGVETEAELFALQTLGCRLGQGYYYGRPMDADKAISYIGPDATMPKAQARGSTC